MLAEWHQMAQVAHDMTYVKRFLYFPFKHSRIKKYMETYDNYGGEHVSNLRVMQNELEIITWTCHNQECLIFMLRIYY